MGNLSVSEKDPMIKTDTFAVQYIKLHIYKGDLKCTRQIEKMREALDFK